MQPLLVQTCALLSQLSFDSLFFAQTRAFLALSLSRDSPGAGARLTETTISITREMPDRIGSGQNLAAPPAPLALSLAFFTLAWLWAFIELAKAIR